MTIFSTHARESDTQETAFCPPDRYLNSVQGALAGLTNIFMPSRHNLLESCELETRCVVVTDLLHSNDADPPQR